MRFPSFDPEKAARETEQKYQEHLEGKTKKSLPAVANQRQEPNLTQSNLIPE